MPRPEISVVIPAYNVEPWLGAAISSVIEARLADEIIIVDDGSSDGTLGVANSFSDPVVTLSQENRGPGAARNRGAKEATCPWILFLDADDHLMEGAASQFHAALDEGDCSVVNPRFRSDHLDVTPGRPMYARTDLWRVILKNPFSGNCLMRRDIWAAHPYPEDLRRCEDLLLWISLLLEGVPIRRTEEPVIERAHARLGAATTDVKAMRLARHEVFRRVSQDRRLTRLERTLLRYQTWRSRIGAIAIRRN